jgi:hypothetical protein
LVILGGRSGLRLNFCEGREGDRASRYTEGHGGIIQSNTT